jgi:hypothetical protein
MPAFTCDECSRTFERRNQLTRHIRNRHSPRPNYQLRHSCGYCGQVFVHRDRAVCHANQQHLGVGYTVTVLTEYDEFRNDWSEFMTDHRPAHLSWNHSSTGNETSGSTPSTRQVANDPTSETDHVTASVSSRLLINRGGNSGTNPLAVYCDDIIYDTQTGHSTNNLTPEHTSDGSDSDLEEITGIHFVPGNAGPNPDSAVLEESPRGSGSSFRPEDNLPNPDSVGSFNGVMEGARGAPSSAPTRIRSRIPLRMDNVNRYVNSSEDDELPDLTAGGFPQ